ncbi:MAG: hypothetical protein E7184_00990 [Erysipelotrichaceae bacterium]|nr:hypothetical protein [Erysipelotrichaceae bacterium]
MRYIKVTETKDYLKTTIEEKSFKKSMLKFWKPEAETLDIKLAEGDLIAFPKKKVSTKKSSVTTEQLIEENN